jgi:hypothetical protein
MSQDTSLHVLWQPNGPSLPSSPIRQNIANSIVSATTATANEQVINSIDDLSTSTPAWSVVTPGVRAGLDKPHSDVKTAKSDAGEDNYRYTSIFGLLDHEKSHGTRPRDRDEQRGSEGKEEISGDFQFLKAGDGEYDMIRVQRRSPRASPRESVRKPLPEEFLSPKSSTSNLLSTNPKQSSRSSSSPIEDPLPSSLFLPSEDTNTTRTPTMVRDFMTSL